ncbi:hypothetical protein ANO11243_067840 [Dothideomycetidae sp. 11243]|nr:hypothetical protein ANO11243_067840 [fungal sp. No.11243]
MPLPAIPPTFPQEKDPWPRERQDELASAAISIGDQLRDLGLDCWAALLQRTWLERTSEKHDHLLERLKDILKAHRRRRLLVQTHACAVSDAAQEDGTLMHQLDSFLDDVWEPSEFGHIRAQLRETEPLAVYTTGPEKELWWYHILNMKQPEEVIAFVIDYLVKAGLDNIYALVGQDPPRASEKVIKSHAVVRFLPRQKAQRYSWRGDRYEDVCVFIAMDLWDKSNGCCLDVQVLPGQHLVIMGSQVMTWPCNGMAHVIAVALQGGTPKPRKNIQQT